MKATKNLNKKTSELEIIVKLNNDDWKKEQEKAFNRLLSKLSVKGFRKGKVDKNFAKQNKLIQDQDVWNEAIQKNLEKGAKVAAEEITEKDNVLASPTYKVEKVSNDEVEIVYVYPTFTDINIKKYKGLKLPYKLMNEKELKESVEKQIDNYASRNALWIPREGEKAKVEKNDKIIFNFKGFVNDEPFEGGEAEDYELTIGSNSFIPGFEEQLIGKKLNTKEDIFVKFPDDYHSEELKSKEAKFEIEIKEIKYKENQKVDEEFVKSLKIENVSNKKELESYLKELTIKEDEEKTKIKFIEEYMDKIIEENKFEVPKTIVLQEYQNLLKKLEENIERYGMKKKDYFSIIGKKEEDISKELIEQAEKLVKQYFIFLKVSKEEKFEPKEKDYESFYKLLAKHRNEKDIEKLKKEVSKDSIKDKVINIMFEEFIIESNK